MADFNELVAAQTKQFKKISDYLKNFKINYKDRMTAGAVESRIRTLGSYWTTYQENDDKLQSLKTRDNLNHPYFSQEEYSLENVEEIYTDSLGEFLHLKDTLSKAENPTSPPAPPHHQAIVHHQSNLPKISLPTFDGDQLQWESFKEVFRARVIDDDNTKPVIKLQHLLSCLQGEASRRLGTLEITEANYQVAWDTLLRRYDNRRLRLTTHLSRLIAAPTVNIKVPKDLNRLLDTFEESIRALRGLERPVTEWDDWFVQLIVAKLDQATRTDWERSREENDDFATYDQLSTFLENRARSQNAAQLSISCNQLTQKGQSSSNSGNKKGSVSAHVTSTGAKRAPPNCSQCTGESHFTFKCPKFLQMTIQKRRDLIAGAENCFNCFGSGHKANKCPSKYNCKKCDGRHHTLLHLDTSASSSSADSTAASGNQQQSTSSTVSVCTATVGGRVLMATALIVLEHGPNKMTVRALLDPAADESFVTEQVVQVLQLKRSPVSTTLSVIGGESADSPKSIATITLKSTYDNRFSMNFSALVLKRLTNLMPSEQVHGHHWSHLQGLQMADPTFWKPGRIDCLLGAEVYSEALLQGLVKGPHPSPIAQNTVFGWVLTGPVKTPSISSRVTCHLIQHGDPDSDQLRRFWEIEESPNVQHLTPEETECENHFQRTHTRDSQGRYMVSLPFKTPPQLPGSKEIAIARFLSLERRLQANSHLYDLYKKFMQEYFTLGHMEPVQDDLMDAPAAYYIPHHGILKNQDKIRVVFNASQRSKNGKTLNDFLHVGPKLQAELLGVITRWRFYRYVFTADIVKMFRQFKVQPSDCDWQRILWRSSSDQPIKAYRLTTVTYGTAPAPYLAIRCLKQLASDEAQQYPGGAAILTNHSYVDDNLGGNHDLNSTIQTRDELIGILASAGMQLDKWSANDPKLLQGLNSSGQELLFEEPVSTLGLKWHPEQDSFQFKVSSKQTPHSITKRTMLSEIASLFDPLGWLAPVIIKAKVYIQELWLRQKDWDVPVDQDLHEAWLSFKKELPDIENISIPRWLFTQKEPHWELHGFSDASERAYAAVIYLVMYSDHNYRSTLISAKTKVAPVKKLSIPRLELCGAQLLSKVIKSTKLNLISQPGKIYCWSDSQTVLAWLKGSPTRWNTFVANRVSEVTTSVPEARWGYVDTLNNPADIATRGATPVQLQQSNLWWHGPDWLQQGPGSWPQHNFEISTDEEKKTSARVFQASVTDDSINQWITRYSSLTRLIRHFSFLFRWKDNSKLSSDTKRIVNPLAKHVSSARALVIKATQRSAFKEDIETLEKQLLLKKSSHLRSLNPFLDANGILRVGGRLQNLAGTYDEKHPAIIPKGSHLAHLLIHDAHHRTLHGGAQLVQSTLRRNYWIVHDRSQIRSAIKKCTKCLRYQGQTQQQLMAPLPTVRLQPARTFTYTGVDYAGPFNIRVSKGRGQKSYKGYVSIFVCMVTRAVHIEIVSDYTSNAFISAFRRFISRRGLCRRVYCDHGTTFQGARTEIHKLFQENTQFTQDIQESLKQLEIEWTFIPPKGPHFGGLWESKVMSFKHHLKRVAGNSTLTFEEFYTLAVQIEACINSRPLSPMTGDSNDVCALTPGHFLIGGPIHLLPDLSSVSDEAARTPTERWLLIQKMLNDFWRRWRIEVLHDLQKRSKWLEPSRNLQLDDIVIIQDDLTPPARWSLGRVIECHPGPDGHTRVVTLKTATTTLKRPVTKLILLPANNQATTHHIAVQANR